MDPSAWIALASVTGFVLLQTAAVAFALGGLFNQVRTLKEQGGADADCKQELAVLTTKFEGMEKAFGEMARDIKNLLTGNARRRSGAGS